MCNTPPRICSFCTAALIFFFAFAPFNFLHLCRLAESPLVSKGISEILFGWVYTHIVCFAFSVSISYLIMEVFLHRYIYFPNIFGRKTVLGSHYIINSIMSLSTIFCLLGIFRWLLKKKTLPGKVTCMGIIFIK